METREAILESILRSVKAEVSQFLADEPEIKCPIEYEKRLIALSLTFGKSILENTQGQAPKSRNLKKK
jgi:hypothetical protein